VIIEIPSADDFKQASLNLLSLAWQMALESLDSYEQSEIIHPQDTPVHTFQTDDGQVHTFGGPDTRYTPEQRAAAEQLFWRRSQPMLGNALSLIQQAVEMGLKGRIAAVSPFLLIARDARDYPGNSTTRDVPFSEFRSLDAADLLRVHNTVCPARLDGEFAVFW
jgi:hypothetical protein